MRTIYDVAGVPVAHYESGQRGERRWAEDLSIPGDLTTSGTTSVVTAALAGWGATALAAVAEPFIAAGARPVHVFHTYTMDLTPSAISMEPEPPAGLRALPARDVPPAALHPALTAAYPPGHPDHQADPITPLAGLYDGSLMGPLSECSTVLADGDRIVAAALVNETEADGPWLSDIFRDPGPRYSGLGATLLRIVIARATSAGLPTLGLAVTDTNPARAVYERLGFRYTDTWIDFILPDPSA